MEQSRALVGVALLVGGAVSARYAHVLARWNERLDAIGSTRRWDEVETRATAIRIGNPVNAPKALPGIRNTDGTAVAVSDEEITAAQRDLAEEGVGVERAALDQLAERFVERRGVARVADREDDAVREVARLVAELL